MARNNVCVFCASGDHVPSIFKECARQLGFLCAKKGIGIVNGAGNMGLMGTMSDACLSAGGQVTGVIPQFMIEHGWQHKELTRLVVTKDMAERKQTMRDLSDGVITLAGGCGTMEELWETITAKQLHLYAHPIIVINTDGFYNPIRQWWQQCVDSRFIRQETNGLVTFVDTPEQALEEFHSQPDMDLNQALERG